MRRLLLLIVFVIVLIGALISYTPLGFVLNQSGAGAAGIGWAKVAGPIAKGRISGYRHLDTNTRRVYWG